MLPKSMLPKKASLTIVSFGALMLFLELAKFARPFAPDAALDFRPRTTTAPEEPARPRPQFTVLTKAPTVVGPNLIDQRESLRTFYQALWRTEAREPGAVTRILHYGDSPVTADSITADVRSLLQEHYGDAGHGFVLIAKPWAWYGHRGVDVRGSGWHIEAASQSRAHDGFHGVGGVSFDGRTGATSQLVLHEDHARMEIKYLRQPGGGAGAPGAESAILTAGVPACGSAAASRAVPAAVTKRPAAAPTAKAGLRRTSPMTRAARPALGSDFNAVGGGLFENIGPQTCGRESRSRATVRLRPKVRRYG